MAEPQFPVASDDFFNRDIKPLRNTFGLTSRESSSITQFETQELQPQLQQMMQLRSQLLRERNSELAYQRGLLEFEEKKRQAQEEINFGERTEEITKSLNNIIEDPTKNNFQKQREIATFGMKNAQILSKFPAASIIFKSAENSLKTRQAEADAADKNLQSTSRAATVGIDPKIFNESINSDGIVTDAEAMEERINQASWDRGQASATSRGAAANKARFDAEEKRLDNELKLSNSEYDSIEKAITAIEDGVQLQISDKENPTDYEVRVKTEKINRIKKLSISDGRTLGELGVTDPASAMAQISKLRMAAIAARRAPSQARATQNAVTAPNGAGASLNQPQPQQAIPIPAGMTPDQLQQLQQLLESFQ